MNGPTANGYLHGSTAQLKGSCSLELQLPVHGGLIDTLLSSLSRRRAIHFTLSFYTALEADAKISCLMCSDSKRSADALANGECCTPHFWWGQQTRAGDYLFTHAHHHALWRILKCSAGDKATMRVCSCVSWWQAEFQQFQFPPPPSRANICSCSAQVQYYNSTPVFGEKFQIQLLCVCVCLLVCA